MQKQFFDALPDGTFVDNYKIQRVLGAGGFGITYLAWDERLHCNVALKEYLPNEMAIRKHDGSTVIARSTEHQDNFQFGLLRFLDEARALARFSEPNIIRVRTFLEANDTAYMVMDYEEGEPLSALLEREGTLDEATLKNLMIPILDGLRAVHREQFLHRDIKPGNIYLRSEGSPVLLDFGAARQALGEHSRSMTGIVTAGYAPFEQYSSRGKQGPWTDLYAIGATMYRAISGHPPVESSERVAAVGEGDPDPLVPATEVGKGRYSEPLLSSIDWMLNLAAKDRPQSVEAVLERLLGRTAAQPAATPTPPPKSTETAPPPTATPPQPKKSSAWPLGIGVLVLALLGLGSWAYLNGQNKTEVQPTAPTTTTISPPATTTQSTSGTAQTDPQPSPPQKTPDPTVATANPQPVEPPPALVGHLQINVNVADANIRLDGQPVGTASPGNPLNLEGLQLGPHRIEVEAAGYQPLSQPTQVEAQQWTQLALQLEPEITMGELIVRSNVSGDTVYIDGNAVGPTGKTPHRLAEGGYTIRVEKKGYKTYEQHVTVISGKQDTLRARLVSDRQPYEPKMVPIPGGSFEMGSPAWEEGRDNDEHLHRVSISSFKLAKTETTRTQWFSVMNDDSPGYAPCDTCPIINVSWKDVQSYISKLNQRTGKLYRLPTEAEWEYACRGGRSADLYCGGNSIDQLAFYAQNSGTWSDEVGQKQPNGYGLYDMSGNVWEWTCSAYDKDYGGGEQRCARQSSDANRSVRGGAFHNRPNMMRSAKRGGFQPAERDYDLGFRLAQD